MCYLWVTENGPKIYINFKWFFPQVCQAGRNTIQITVSACCCSHLFVLQLVHRFVLVVVVFVVSVCCWYGCWCWCWCFFLTTPASMGCVLANCSILVVDLSQNPPHTHSLMSFKPNNDDCLPAGRACDRSFRDSWGSGCCPWSTASPRSSATSTPSLPPGGSFFLDLAMMCWFLDCFKNNPRQIVRTQPLALPWGRTTWNKQIKR